MKEKRQYSALSLLSTSALLIQGFLCVPIDLLLGGWVLGVLGVVVLLHRLDVRLSQLAPDTTISVSSTHIKPLGAPLADKVPCCFLGLATGLAAASATGSSARFCGSLVCLGSVSCGVLLCLSLTSLFTRGVRAERLRASN